MTRWRAGAILVVVALMAVLPLGQTARAAEPVNLTLFWLEGCPHCAAEKEFLAGLRADVPSLTVEAYEVRTAEGRQRFLDTADRLGFDASGVPVTVIGDRYWIGFTDSTGAEIRAAVVAAAAGESLSDGTSNVVNVPFFGKVDVGTKSLLVATLVIGFVDGFNPCSLWVLSVLLALVLRTGSRRRVAAVGITFLVVTASLYGLYIAGIYTFLAYAAYIVWIQRGAGVLAGGLGAINIKDYLWYGRGVSLSIGEKRKSGIIKRARGLADPTRSLPGILAATALLATGVSLAETPCTAGLPIVWTNLLAVHKTGFAAAAALFAIYMVVFLADELLVFGLALVTMRAAKLQEKHGRALKLIGGCVMLALGVAMIATPSALSSPLAMLGVFAGASAGAAAIALVWHAVHRTPQRPARPAVHV
ncbi:MAG: glutaredoxin family protein [Actinomycetota bacterium]